MNNELIFYKLETSMHMGCGDELGIVDMPIAREKVTGFPKMEASGIKGSFNEQFPEEITIEKKVIGSLDIKTKIFGAEDTSGNLIFSDGRILLFPMKSAKGTFVWVTCPYVLNRFMNDCEIRGIEVGNINKTFEDDSQKIRVREIKVDPKKQKNISWEQLKNAVTQENCSALLEDNYIIIEEYNYKVENVSYDGSILKFIINKLKDANGQKAYINQKFETDICIIPDEDFKDFVEMYTEINTRNKINKNGISENLFTEEYLPVETVMYGYIGEIQKSIKTKNQIEESFEIFMQEINREQYIQFGGNKTLGKGITKIILGDKNE